MIPNRKTKKGPNQDDQSHGMSGPKCIPTHDLGKLGLPGGRSAEFRPPSPGVHLRPPKVPKPIQKRTKIETKIQDEKKATQDDLGPILERSWVDLGPILGSIWVKNRWKTQCFVKNHFFEDEAIRRRFRDQLGAKKAST